METVCDKIDGLTKIAAMTVLEMLEYEFFKSEDSSLFPGL